MRLALLDAGYALIEVKLSHQEIMPELRDLLEVLESLVHTYAQGFHFRSDGLQVWSQKVLKDFAKFGNLAHGRSITRAIFESARKSLDRGLSADGTPSRHWDAVVRALGLQFSVTPVPQKTA